MVKRRIVHVTVVHFRIHDLVSIRIDIVDFEPGVAAWR
jgi:hypothetical protein